MHKSSKIIAAVSIAVLAAAGGTAFTATGVTTTGQASSAQFVGGTVSQSVDGATLNSIVYAYADGTNTAIHTATLTFADALTDTKVPTVVFTAETPVAFTCTAIEATGHSSTCTAEDTDQTGATGIAVTVASTNVS